MQLYIERRMQVSKCTSWISEQFKKMVRNDVIGKAKYTSREAIFGWKISVGTVPTKTSLQSSLFSKCVNLLIFQFIMWLMFEFPQREIYGCNGC